MYTFAIFLTRSLHIALNYSLLERNRITINNNEQQKTSNGLNFKQNIN